MIRNLSHFLIFFGFCNFGTRFNQEIFNGSVKNSQKFSKSKKSQKISKKSKNLKKSQKSQKSQKNQKIQKISIKSKIPKFIFFYFFENFWLFWDFLTLMIFFEIFWNMSITYSSKQCDSKTYFMSNLHCRVRFETNHTVW